MIGGRGGIRTHGGFPHARFRVECLKPDSATLPLRKKEHRTVNGPTSSVRRKYHADDPVCGMEDLACRVPPRAALALADGISGLTRPKNVTIFGLPGPASLLHLVCPHGQP